MFVQVCEEFNIISRKLREKPTSIEELTEKRDWMKQIPEQIKSYKVHSEGFNLLFCKCHVRCYSVSNSDLIFTTGTYLQDPARL